MASPVKQLAMTIQTLIAAEHIMQFVTQELRSVCTEVRAVYA